MAEYNLITSYKDMPSKKETVSCEFVDALRRHLKMLPPGTCVERVPNVVQVWRSEELILPKQNYEQVLNRVQEFLQDDKFAGYVVSLVEAIESDHVSISFEPKSSK